MGNKTTKTFVEELGAINPDIIVLGEYSSTHTPILVKCAICGHEWSAHPSNLLKHHGCPKCANVLKKTQEDFEKELAKVHPQLVVAGTYTNNKTPVKIKCRLCNYEKLYNPYKILKRKEPCPVCKSRQLNNEKQKKKELKEKELNEKKLRQQEGFFDRLKQISPTISILDPYNGYNTKIKCKCHTCGNEWFVTPNHLIQGRRCPICAIKKNSQHQKKTHEQYAEELEIKNPAIELLSRYEGAKEKILCRCKLCNNVWEANASSLLCDHGCPECAKKNVASAHSFSQEEFVDKVKKNNPNVIVLGKLNTTTKPVKCQCKKCGKIWFPIASSILRGSSCPDCSHTSTSMIEQLIYFTAKVIYRDKEVCSRNRKEIGVELDVFIPEEKLAIEYGSWYWHKEKIDEDKTKKKKCEEKNIRLVQIFDSCPADVCNDDKDIVIYHYDLSASKSRQKEMIERLIKILSLDFHMDDEMFDEIRKQALINSRRKDTNDFLMQLKSINNDIAVIGNYLGYKLPIHVKCKRCGNEWDAFPGHLLRGIGCSKCAGNKRKTPELFRDEIATKIAGVSVIDDYINASTRIRFQCKHCKHMWAATPNNMLRGTPKYCQNCKRELRRPLEYHSESSNASHEDNK